MIRNIEVTKLVPHSNNPRKSLGDLAELAESIKAQGVLQNLTVVSNHDLLDTYTVIIGHRRLEGSKIAGLKSVPCAVVELSDQQQVSMMLLENMQRSDLTPYEQAQGFQQCLDLGISVDDLSKSTGFSKKTVKHRLKMLELDQEKVKNAQGSIDEYIALEEIKSINERNRLLVSIGTNNFNLELEKAKRAQDKMKTEKVVVGKVGSETAEKESIPEIVNVSLELRKNFMKEVFVRKIAPAEVAEAVAVINSQFIFDETADIELFHEIVNPNDMDNDDLIIRMLSHRSNFLIVSAYSVLEYNEKKKEVYRYLKELGYVISDAEQEMIDHEDSE